MPTYQLDERIWFPDRTEFEHDVVAVGGDLRPERVALAYASGIFPWFDSESEIMWWCPKKRCVLFLDQIHISHSMKSIVRSNRFRISMDNSFDHVIRGCQNSRDRFGNTWISEEVISAFTHLHEAGIVHSVEAWLDGKLAGGLYGVCLGKMFCGESMFSNESNSSKAALIHLCNKLSQAGFTWIDCQIYNPHLGSMGATEISRNRFLNMMDQALKHETIRGSWSNHPLFC